MNLQNFKKQTGLLMGSILLLSSNSFSQSPGELDPSFSSDGIVTTTVGTSNEQAYDIAITADNKIVAVGQTWNGNNNDMIVIRYNADGTLDNSFSGDGIVVTPVGAGNDYSEGVALQADGKIVVCGETEQGTELDVIVLRYNTDGTLDQTFDADGKKIVDYGPGDDIGRDVKIQVDGKIIICGTTFNGSNSDLLVARFNTNGSPDVSFNTTGYVKKPIGPGNDAVFQLEIQPDGKIAAGGYISTASAGDPDVLLIRLNANGTMDNTFDGDGISITQWGGVSANAGSAYCLELQSDGKIVMGGRIEVPPLGTYSGRMVVARYNSNGTFDQSFANNGIFDISISTTGVNVSETINDIAIQADGKIVATASSYYGMPPASFLLLRITTNGTLDNSFGGGDGYVFTDIGNDNLEDLATVVKIQPDGKIIQGGYTFNGSNNDVAIVRYLAEGSGPANCFSAPLWLFADNIGSTKATVHWDPLTGANKYKVQYRVSGTKTWSSVNATTNEKTLKNLTASTTYEYRVKGICANGSSPWSNTSTFTTSALRMDALSSNPEELTVSIYPNPASDVLNISVNKEISNGTIIIHDINGRTMLSQMIMNNNQVDVSTLSPGVYIVEVRAENLLSTFHKIIVN
ncbi:MAG: T9SS type A sorting domain-containing protein [Chitinophagales bacterium]|nr:T9SS type A sorting domain-containing protein [Chitinophagales bacterium]